MTKLEDPEVQALLGQIARTSRITGWVVGGAAFTALLGGAMVATGRLWVIPIGALLSVGLGVVWARENTKARAMRRQLMDLMFPKAP